MRVCAVDSKAVASIVFEKNTSGPGLTRHRPEANVSLVVVEMGFEARFEAHFGQIAPRLTGSRGQFDVGADIRPKPESRRPKPEPRFLARSAASVKH